jgi:3',5'-cyclic-nucleotide phosphodiesterase
MRYAVDEILMNNSVWDKKIKDAQEKKKKIANMSLGLLSPGFSADPTPSPFSGPPLKLPSGGAGPARNQPTDAGLEAKKVLIPSESNRRSSSGSFHSPVSSSRKSSKGSRHSSGAGVPGTRPITSYENQSQSRRGSGDASLTAILITQAPNSSDKPANEANASSPTRSASPPGKRKDTLTRTSPQKTFGTSSGESEKESPRPVTAPSSARRTQGKHSRPPA